MTCITRSIGSRFPFPLYGTLLFPLALLVHCGTERHRWLGCIPMSVSACLSVSALSCFFFPPPCPLTASDSAPLTEPRGTNHYQGKTCYAALSLMYCLFY